jgi:CRP/FNR family cyclic AMP-dependent transcriptional regulator
MQLDPYDQAIPRTDVSGGDFAIFKNLSEAEWADVLRFAERQSITRGARILTAGESDRSLHIIVKGTVDVLVDGPDGPKAVAAIGEGSVVGEMAFFDGGPRSAHVDARDDVEILGLTPGRFHQLAVAHPRLAQRILFDLGRVLSQRLRRQNRGAIDKDASAG